MTRFGTVGAAVLALIVVSPGFAADPSATPSVAELAQAYRVQAYLSHHHDRIAYQQHRQAAETMLTRWKEMGTPKSNEFAGWFRDARNAAAAGQSPPRMPQFDTRSLERLPMVKSGHHASLVSPASTTRDKTKTSARTLNTDESVVEAMTPSPPEEIAVDAEKPLLDLPAAETTGVESSKSPAEIKEPAAKGTVHATVRALLRALTD